MKILLVDDSFAMRRIEKNVLEKIGFTDVDEADDGASAIVKLSAQKYDLVLMDWNMPNMKGIDALRKIKETESLKGIPVVMVTSESEKSKVMEALKAGAANYVVKPFEPERLKEKLGPLLK